MPWPTSSLSSPILSLWQNESQVKSYFVCLRCYRWPWLSCMKMSYRCLTTNLYSFVWITRPKFLSTYQIIFFRTSFGDFLTLYEVFIQLCAWIEPFGGNESNRLGVMEDAFNRWYSCNIVAEETVAFNMLMNLSGPFLTRVSTLNWQTLVVQLQFFCLYLLGLLHFDY